MEKFIERQNIARFTALLMTETDTAKRELLQKLLTNEMVIPIDQKAATGLPRVTNSDALKLLMSSV